jgi:hypothetical protein
MCLPASVANKRLVAWLSSLDATLTKNKGVGSADARMPGNSDATTFRRLDVLSPIAAERPWCNNERRSGKQLRSPRCLSILSGHRGQVDLGPLCKSCLGPSF